MRKWFLVAFLLPGLCFGQYDPKTGRISSGTSAGQVPIWDGAKYVPGDPLVQGTTAHDAPGATTNPIAMGCYANAAAPSDVSADVDVTRGWCLRNGSLVVNLAAGGSLIGATSNALDINIKSGSIANTTFGATQGTSPWVVGQSTATSLKSAAHLYDAAGNGLTSNSTTYTAKFGLDGNLLGTLGTAFTTAGFVDIKGADGNVFVRQTTGTNLHAVIDSGSTTAVTQGTGTNLHTVVDSGTITTVSTLTSITNQVDTNLKQIGGTNTVTGGVAGLLAVAGNVAIAGSATANPVPVGGIFQTTPATLTNGQTASMQFTSAQNLKHDITTIAGTAPTTAGFIDIKGADGNVFVRQTTASNLHAAATLDAETTKVIGTVRVLGNAGAIFDGATGAAVPANTVYMGGNGSGNNTGVIVCDNSSVVNMSSATTTQIIAISGTAGRTYICSMNLVTAAANNVALISGSGSNCASNQAGLAGGTSAASGWNFAANGGLTMGSGLGMVIKTTTTNNEVCLVTSASTQLSGSITWTQF